MSTIISKAKKYMDSREGKAMVERKIDEKIRSGEWDISSAGDQFINVLQQEILSRGAGGNFTKGFLGPTAISALINLSSSRPYKIGKRRYAIDISFVGDLHRESLDPTRYDGINNIAALLNSGYSAGGIVYGIWHGHGDAVRHSLDKRGGAHFIENAVRNYMTGYSKKYKVIDININKIYS